MPQWGQFFSSRCSSFRVKRTFPSQKGQWSVRGFRMIRFAKTDTWPSLRSGDMAGERADGRI